MLNDVTFDIKPGLMTGFVGGNGAGKTTTMRSILGVLNIESGSIEVDGEPISPDYRASIGYMPEERGLYPKMKILDQLVYLAQLHGMGTKEARRRGTDLLERLGLGERMQDKLEELSLGNQQRAQIAAALVHDPVALILDEPFSGLDPVAVDTTLSVLRDVADSGAPVLFSSHQLDLVERVCDELVIIASGQVRARGTRQEILDSSTRPEWQLRSDADLGWVRSTEVAEVEVIEFDGTFIRFNAESVDAANRVLDEARGRGVVEQFGPVRHSLHEIFKETIQ